MYAGERARKSMVSVQVFRRKSGEPASSQKVAVGTPNGVTASQYTDRSGEAHFGIRTCQGKVFVNGRVEYQGELSGRLVVYI